MNKVSIPLPPKPIETNQNGNAHGDDNPDRRDAAGLVELLFLADGHKAQQDVRHAKVAEAPCERGDDAQSAVRRGRAGRGVVALRHVEIARQRAGVVDDRVQSARLLHAEAHNDDERDRHEDRLDQVGERNGHEAAHHRVQHDHNAADDHRRVVLHTKKAVEERADGLEAGRRVRDKENEDHAAMQESRCFLSPKRRAKKSGIVMAPSLAEYRRRRRATISQLRYVPMARPMAVHVTSGSPQR